MKLDRRLPRTRRLTTRRQFLAVYGRGTRVNSASFTLFGLPNGLDTCRLGIAVPRRVGSATTRNRVKRLLREVFRLHRVELGPAVDLVINAHPSIGTQGLRDLEREFLHGFRRLSSRLGGSG